MKMKILFVGDSQDNQDFFGKFFTKFHEVDFEIAEDGFQAVDSAGTKTFDLILLDIPLPYLDGIETADLIRRNNINKNTRIIILENSDTLTKDKQLSYQQNDIEIIEKPFGAENIENTLKVYLHSIQREIKINSDLQEVRQKLEEESVNRQNAESLLNKIQENFKNIVGKSRAAILIIDDEGILKFINPSGEEIFQRAAKEIVGKPFGLVADLENKSEITILRKDKQIGTGEISASRTYWENEPAWLVLINDITDHKNLEQYLVKAKEDAQNADRLKTAFLSNMSHEIRTPMNGIVGFVDILEKEPDLSEEDKKKFLSIIKTSSNHLLSLVNDIIDISKIEAGQMVINVKNCNVADLVVKIYEFFASNPKITENNIDFSFQIPVGENQIISTDGDRLRQVLINLIGNSIKYTEAGFITFGYTIQDNSRLVFFVEDTGTGIPKEFHATIFDRFVQVIDNKKTYMSGTGLGLAISKSLVELLGGEIWIESEENKGTTFYLSIPMIQKDASEFTADKTKKLKWTELDEIKIDKTILIVEDIPTNFLLLDNILRRKGSKTIWAKNGKEAIAICRENNISLVLMDMKMPEMDGYSATREIRKFNKKVPIIAQTAYALEGESDKSIEAGCNEYISKPIDQTELFTVIKKYI